MLLHMNNQHKCLLYLLCCHQHYNSDVMGNKLCGKLLIPFWQHVKTWFSCICLKSDGIMDSHSPLHVDIKFCDSIDQGKLSSECY